MSEPIELWKVLVDECKHLGQPLDAVDIQKFKTELQAAEQSPISRDKDAALAAAFKAEAVEAVQSSILRRIYNHIHSLPTPRAALCLSGGGIRSATFALGVLQALAKLKLLERFDYLSTVSGGGYIGSWLSAWAQREEHGIHGVAAQLGNTTKDPLDPEPVPLARLRDYTRYLSPRTGLFSADLWTLASTYIRNLLLNWLVLLPLIAAVICIPRILPPLIGFCLPTWLAWLLLCVGIALQCYGMSFMAWNRMVHKRHRINTQKGFICFCLVELILAAFLITLAWPSLIEALSLEFDRRLLLEFVGIASAIGFVAAGAAGLLARNPRPSPGPGRPKPTYEKVIQEIVLEVVAAAFGAFLVWCAAKIPALNPNSHPVFYGSFAVPLYMLAFLLGAVVLRGLSSYLTTEEDREWSARAGAWVLIVIAFWSMAAGIVIYLPVVFANNALWRWLLGAITGAAGVSTALLGKSPQTPANSEQATQMVNRLGSSVKTRQWALAAAAPLFIVCLCAGISLAISAALTHWLKGVNTSSHLWPLSVVEHSAEWWMPVGCVGLIAASQLFGYFVNVNKFSLHAVYRNRLVRAYLGASRRYRQESPTYDAFAGFDPDDDLPMHHLRSRPFHIINIALNLSAGKRLAWQERKAESFTVSALHCGSAELGYRPATEYGGGIRMRGLRPERAISLGTALTISGAAANPNMGYHSSAPIAFIMSMFNVRLGAWLGNPGRAGSGSVNGRMIPPYGLAGPRIATRPLVEEALGLTDDENPYVNLSDGGHFENLGIYEMVRRRCRMIVVCDAGHDPSCGFEDLGNAIRKIYIDMGVRISFDDEVLIRPRQPDPQSTTPQAVAKYCALGTIHYEEVDYQEPGAVAARPGCLLYLKPAFYQGVPLDVYSYGQQYSDFPHQSTADQFFTESQFESYRALGEYVIEEIVKVSGVRPRALEGLFQAAKIYVARGAPLAGSPKGRCKG